MFLLCPSGLPPKGQRIGFEEPSLHNKLRNSEHLSVLLVAHGMSTNGVPRPPLTSVSFHRKCIKVHPKENITCSHTAIESRLASSKLLLAGALHAVRLARSASFLPSYIDHRPYGKNPSQPGNAVRAIYSGMAFMAFIAFIAFTCSNTSIASSTLLLASSALHSCGEVGALCLFYTRCTSITGPMDQ